MIDEIQCTLEQMIDMNKYLKKYYKRDNIPVSEIIRIIDVVKQVI